MTLQATALLHADPVFPARDLLLDSHYVAQQLASSLGRTGRLNVEDCERSRATYRPGKSFRVVYEFRAEAQRGIVAARALSTGSRPPRFEDPLQASCNDEWRLRFFDQATDTVFWVFPHDRKIAKLPDVMKVSPAFSELLDSQWIESRIVAYASEKCATVQCLDGEQRVLAYAKAYAGDDGWASYNAYNALYASRGAFRVPRPILYSSSNHLLMTEAIEGRRIADLETDQVEQGCYELGRTLGAFHSAQIPGDVPEFERFHPDRLREACDCIGMARPDSKLALTSLCQSLCSQADSLLRPAVCLHGDVHPKNGILSGSEIVLIDLDQISRGPAAADLGSLLAALRYDVIVGELSDNNAQCLAQAFLSGYEVSRPLPAPCDLRWYTAAALLAERASRAVTRVRTRGLEKLNEVLVVAQELLEGN